MNMISLLFFVSLFAMCNGLEDGWRNVKPLHTNSDQVTRIFGEKGNRCHVCDSAIFC